MLLTMNCHCQGTKYLSLKYILFIRNIRLKTRKNYAHFRGRVLIVNIITLLIYCDYDLWLWSLCLLLLAALKKQDNMIGLWMDGSLRYQSFPIIFDKFGYRLRYDFPRLDFLCQTKMLFHLSSFTSSPS